MTSTEPTVVGDVLCTACETLQIHCGVLLVCVCVCVCVCHCVGVVEQAEKHIAGVKEEDLFSSLNTCLHGKNMFT